MWSTTTTIKSTSATTTKAPTTTTTKASTTTPRKADFDLHRVCVQSTISYCWGRVMSIVIVVATKINRYFHPLLFRNESTFRDLPFTFITVINYINVIIIVVINQNHCEPLAALSPPHADILPGAIQRDLTQFLLYKQQTTATENSNKCYEKKFFFFKGTHVFSMRLFWDV